MNNQSYKYDAVVIGSGPNGLAAAITLQKAGLKTLVLEGKETPGGGLRTLELTLPGFRHDICSSIHPMTLVSPFFREIPLDDLGVEWLHAPIAASHSIDRERIVEFHHSLEKTSQGLGSDSGSYQRLMTPIVRDLELLANDFLGPLKLPGNFMATSSFGIKALQSAEGLTQRRFYEEEARALFAGMAAHAAVPLNYLASSAVALILMAAGHRYGWPFPKGGAQRIADALISHYRKLGGEVKTGFQIDSLQDLPNAGKYLFDVAPRNLLTIAGNRLPKGYRRQLNRYEHGAGAFKVDWALDKPIPFLNRSLAESGTVHIGGSFTEMAAGELAIDRGKLPKRPFILLAQHSRFDPERAPSGKHTAWAYCHVPHGSKADMTDTIEAEIEKIAPGFRDSVLGKHTISADQFSSFNPNIIGGDINNGKQKFSQLFTRPSWRLSPYTTPDNDIFICSSATPPGGGVHGMCGFHAAKKVLSSF